jgi:dTDP-4-dehydrorhamnose reductase
MKVMIIGALGMLGSDLVQVFSQTHEVLGLDRPEIDIVDAEQCRRHVGDYHPDIVLNAAALTDVDYCEGHEEGALQVNGYGAGNLASAAAGAGAAFVHYSTDYVFDGQKDEAYREDDATSPLNAYGRSKLAGEELVQRCCPDHLVLRTSWLFGRNGKNFIRTIVTAARTGRALRVVRDQRGSPTYTHDLALQTARMVEASCRGVYHATNSGSCSWYELAVRAVDWAGIKDVSITPVSTPEFPRPARRPANSVLANTRLQGEALPLMRPWPIAVREYVKHL